MANDEFTCASCGRTFTKDWTDEEARAEAEATFTEDELTDVATVCDDCWRAMRHQWGRRDG